MPDIDVAEVSVERRAHVERLVAKFPDEAACLLRERVGAAFKASFKHVPECLRESEAAMRAAWMRSKYFMLVESVLHEWEAAHSRAAAVCLPESQGKERKAEECAMIASMRLLDLTKPSYTHALQSSEARNLDKREDEFHFVSDFLFAVLLSHYRSAEELYRILRLDCMRARLGWCEAGAKLSECGCDDEK